MSAPEYVRPEWEVVWGDPAPVLEDVDQPAGFFGAAIVPGKFDPAPVVTFGQLTASTSLGEEATAGQVLSSGWDGGALVVVDGLSITWGRDSVLDQPTATLGRLQLFDTTKTWATSEDRRGQAVTIGYRGLDAGGVERSGLHFRGRIGSPIKVSRKTIIDPDTGREVHGSLVNLPLQSALVDGANIVPRVAWPAETMGARLVRVVAAFQAAGLLTGGADLRDYWEAPNVAPVAAKDQVSLLDHLTALYDSAGADKLSYYPETDQVRYQSRKDFPSLRGVAGLWWDGSDPTQARAGQGVYIRSHAVAPPGGAGLAGLPVYLDAATLEYDPGDGIVTPARITRVVISHPDEGAAYATRTVETRVKSDEGAAADERVVGTRTARVESLVAWNSYADVALSDTEYLVRREGSAWQLQPLVLSTRKLGGFETVDAAVTLLAGNERNTLVFLQRSWLPEYGLRPVYGVMGGVIAYRRRGWELEVNVGPITTTQLQHAITWEEIDDGSAAYEVQWWDDDHPRGMHASLTYEDLGYCATGLNVSTIPADQGFDR